MVIELYRISMSTANIWSVGDTTISNTAPTAKWEPDNPVHHENPSNFRKKRLFLGRLPTPSHVIIYATKATSAILTCSIGQKMLESEQFKVKEYDEL